MSVAVAMPRALPAPDARVQSEQEEVCREAAALREKVMKLEKNGEVRARALEEEATALQMANAGLEEDNLELALRLRDPRSRSAPPLPERTISRADQLAMRVAELEEQLWTVTTHRRKAERAAAEVLAILESQGFSRFSDAVDSGSDDDDDTGGSKARGEAEDALSGLELAGGLSWKGRAAGYDSERRQPQQKGRQLRLRHSLSNGRSYFYLLAADSSPKYQPGQSCRKIKRKELMRLQTEGEEGKHNVLGSPEEGQEISDCTVCTDEQHDLDGEVSQDGQGSCGDGRVEDGSRYAMEYEQDGEMERVLEKQADLVGRYEAEENAQREWEKKFNESSDSTADDVHSDKKLKSD